MLKLPLPSYHEHHGSEELAVQSPGSSSTASSGSSRPGRPRNLWSSEQKRQAVRLYLFTTLTQTQNGHILGMGYCKSDNERRIRELFLKKEVPSRRKWCRRNEAGHRRTIAQWDLFEQYRVVPWKNPRSLTNCENAQIASTGTSETNRNEVDRNQSPQSESYPVFQTEASRDAVDRINQLADKYEPAHLRSVAQVYCHSMTSRVRSSWNSLTSTFRSSRASSIFQRNSLYEDEGLNLDNHTWGASFKNLPPNCPLPLTPKEKEVWEILIDEDQLMHDEDDDAYMTKANSAKSTRCLLLALADSKKLKRPAVPNRFSLELALRPCGDQHLSGALLTNIPGNGCGVCGCSIVHEIAHLGDSTFCEYAGINMNQKDFYDNTPLFYYVRSPYFTMEGLKQLISNGADIMARNTSGASFMHCFVWDWWRQNLPEFQCSMFDTLLYELIDLLEFLASIHFPFSCRNEHGQTIAHLLFEHMYQYPVGTPNLEQLERILIATNTDTNAFDNQGRCVGQYLDYRGLALFDHQSQTKYEALFRKVTRFGRGKSRNSFLDFGELFSETPRRGRSWPAIAKARQYANLIDVKGNSPLTAMLKAWDDFGDIDDRQRHIETLVEMGIDINLKDRRGNTALVIAARRGYRTTVEYLLQLGANPNTVNYSGRSVLYMTKGWLGVAEQQNNDSLYARIASCIPVLQEWQAHFEPSIHLQCLSLRARLKLCLGPSQSSPSP